MKANVVALPVALQRYVDAPPVAVRQRELAEVIALQTRARIFVVTSEAPMGLVAQAETVAQKLDAFIAPLIAAGITVEKRILEGRPIDVLPEAIRAAAADVAIVGSHSKRRTVEVTLGTTASGLLRDLACPVFLVRPTREDEEQAKKMIIPHYPNVFTYL